MLHIALGVEKLGKAAASRVGKIGKAAVEREIEKQISKVTAPKPPPKRFVLW